MPPIIITLNDSETHCKLLMLLGEAELQIDDPEYVAGNNYNSVSTTGIVTLFDLPTPITLTESKGHRNKSVELQMEATAPVTLASLTGLLQLNPSYDMLYQALDLCSFKLYARATEGRDFEYLTIEGSLSDDKQTLLGFLAEKTDISSVLKGLTLAVHISHRRGSYKKNIRVTITAELKLDDQILSVEISVPTGHDELWSLRLLPPGINFKTATLVKFFMGQAALPEQVERIPDFNLNSFTIEFNPWGDTQLRHIGMVLGVGSKSHPWVILGTEQKPTVSLNNINLTLNLYWDHANAFSYHGVVNGDGTINDFNIKATIPLPLQGNMTLEANSADPTKRLDLGKFSEGLVDNGGIGAHLPNGAIPKFSLHLNKLRLVIDLHKELTKSTIQQFELDVESSGDGAWKIWDKHLELRSFGLQIQLQKQNDEWQTSGALYGKGSLQQTEVTVRIEKAVTGPWGIALVEPVIFNLENVAELTGINLKTNTNNALPATINNSEAKSITLRKFKLLYQQTEPKLPYLGLYVETKGELDIIPGKLLLSEVFCILEQRSTHNETKRYIRVRGKITIEKHPISLVAQKTDEETGWEYEGKTEPGDTISLNGIMSTLLQPTGVKLPATLPHIAVNNIELKYAPKIKQVIFKGAAHVNITEKIRARFALELKSKDESLVINGSSTIELCDAAIALTAKHDSEGWLFTGSAYDEIILTDLLQKMLANTVLALPEVLPGTVTLQRAKFAIAPALKYHLLSGKIKQAIKLPWAADSELDAIIDVTLERPAVKTPDAPAEKLKVSLDASAELTFGKGRIKFEGSYSTDKKGWELAGELHAEGLTFDELAKNLGNKFGTQFQIPTALGNDLPLMHASATLNTATKTFACNTGFKFTINKKEVDVTTRLTLTQNHNKTNTYDFEGKLALGKPEAPHIFNLNFNNSWMLATYTSALDNSSADLGDFVNGASGITIQLNKALMAYQPAGKKLLFLVDIGSGINLNNLPLVGRYFTPDKTLKLNLQIEYANAELKEADIRDLNALLTASANALTLPAEKIEKDSRLLVNLHIGEAVIPVDLNLELTKKIDANEHPAENNAVEDNTLADDNIVKQKDNEEGTLTKWFDVQKKLGPLYFNRIGIGFRDGQLQFMLDASIAAYGLTIALEGLTVSNPLNKIAPVFSLKGLGIDYQNDAIEIGGSFLRTHINKKDTDGYDEYDGLAIIKMKGRGKDENGFTINAIGSYTSVNGVPSLFVYAALNYPIGGPTFFFVTGLSAGFGYNRKLVMPKLSKVMEFPLLAETLQGKTLPANAGRDHLLQELQTLHQYIPPANGHIFLAIGITFSSFKVINTSLLLVASFGNRFELDLLGVSTITVPYAANNDVKKISNPLAHVTMQLKGSFIPSQGFLGIRGIIAPKSYILSKDCIVSGGFAFFAWFDGEHKGDFVATVGGYHPRFKVPAHYPTVPRLAFNWKLSDHMLIKGDAYFALCARAFMAGGHLNATFEEGGLKAWFNMEADFLVAWQPYHYEARMYVNIGCSYTFEFCGTQHITLDLGADVNIWGPDFGGRAVLHLWVFSIDVYFGNQECTSLTPIDWNTFSDSFLTKSNHINITISKGLVAKGKDDNNDNDLEVVNPKDLTITTSAFIPIKTASVGNNKLNGNWNTEFGIGSMELDANHLLCSQIIKIEKTDGKNYNAEEHFKFTAITQKVPAGLWGTTLKPKINDAQFIENALTGFTIQPLKDPAPGNTITVDRKFIQFETTSHPSPIAWETKKDITENKVNDSKAIINQDIIQKNRERKELLHALGLNYTIDLSAGLANDLITDPVIIAS